MHKKGESMIESIFWHMFGNGTLNGCTVRDGQKLSDTLLYKAMLKVIADGNLPYVYPTQGPFTLPCTGLQPVADVFNHRLGVVETYVKDFVRCSCSGNKLQQFYESLHTLWNYIHHFLAEGN
ncbi:hypothetical protein L596_008902 [Steinernema carpocapsae]|nr:hypothetical protein L596_008902 [Steinernema carpocapsae]